MAVPTQPAPQQDQPKPTVYPCFHCSGRGEIPVHYPDDRGGVFCNWQRCRHCDGTGKHEHLEAWRTA